MGYNISICYPESDEVIRVDSDVVLEAASYEPHGTTLADFVITFNYFELYQTAGLDISRDLNGRRISEVRSLLQEKIDVLGTNNVSDYWAKTPGNAGRALSNLLKLFDIVSPIDGVIRVLK